MKEQEKDEEKDDQTPKRKRGKSMTKSKRESKCILWHDWIVICGFHKEVCCMCMNDTKIIIYIATYFSLSLCF